MQGHLGFMLLYTETWGRGGAYSFKFLAPPEDFDKLWERAKRHVGTRSETDGCSTEPQQWVRGEVSGIAKNDSFGGRSATIERIPILR